MYYSEIWTENCTANIFGITNSAAISCFILQFLDIQKCLIPHRCDVKAKGMVLDHVYKFKEMLLYYVNEGNSNFCEYLSSELWCTKLPFHGCLSI